MCSQANRKNIARHARWSPALNRAYLCGPISKRNGGWRHYGHVTRTSNKKQILAAASIALASSCPCPITATHLHCTTVETRVHPCRSDIRLSYRNVTCLRRTALEGEEVEISQKKAQICALLRLTIRFISQTLESTHLHTQLLSGYYFHTCCWFPFFRGTELTSQT